MTAAHHDATAPPAADGPPATPTLPARLANAPASKQPAAPALHLAATRVATSRSLHTAPATPATLLSRLARKLDTAWPLRVSARPSTSRRSQCGASSTAPRVLPCPA